MAALLPSKAQAGCANPLLPFAQDTSQRLFIQSEHESFLMPVVHYVYENGIQKARFGEPALPCNGPYCGRQPNGARAYHLAGANNFWNESLLPIDALFFSDDLDRNERVPLLERRFDQFAEQLDLRPPIL